MHAHYGRVNQCLFGAPLLRFQPLDGAQANREVALDASQSGEARFGARAGTVALEQLSLLQVRKAGLVRINDRDVMRMSLTNPL
jgi:hypothetical protein